MNPETNQPFQNLTNKELAGGISILEEDSQKDAANQFDAITEEDIDESLETLGTGNDPITAEMLQKGAALDDELKRFNEEKEVEKALKIALDTAEKNPDNQPN